MTMSSVVRPGAVSSHLQVGAPPGKTAISRTLAPLLPTVSGTQAGPRPSYASLPAAAQPSPKSKQKMSPRGGAGQGLGRPQGLGNKPTSGLKMVGAMPRMSNHHGSPLPGSPGTPPHSSPRPPLMSSVATSSPGPATLKPRW